MIQILESLKLAHIFKFKHICLCNIFTNRITLVLLNNLRNKELLVKFLDRLLGMSVI